MREIKIKGKIYILKYSYKAAKCQECVQKAFELVTGASMLRNISNAENPSIAELLSGVSEQVSEIPSLCDTFMYAGLMSENKVETEEIAGDLLIDYMEENEKSYNDMFESFKECMIEDGFFKVSGIEQMVEQMNKGTEEVQTPEAKIPAKKTVAKKTVAKVEKLTLIK